MSSVIKKISTMEAIELGRIEGIKEVLTEMEEMLENSTDKTFLKAYVKARRKSLEDSIKERMSSSGNSEDV